MDHVDHIVDPERLGNGCSFAVRALVRAGRREVRKTCLTKCIVQCISILMEGGNTIKLLLHFRPSPSRQGLARPGIGLTVRTSSKQKRDKRSYVQ